jgi:signal recognition particle GTPase
VTKSLKPGQEMIGIVHRRLVELLGGDPDDGWGGLGADGSGLGKGHPGIMKVSPGPTVIMMCGCRARARRRPAASWRPT